LSNNRLGDNRLLEILIKPDGVGLIFALLYNTN
jgi:hypothetical protein